MLRIVVVDDEAVTAIDLERSLRTMGYEVVGTAASGEDAVEMARGLRPDLVLMDILVPGNLDGISAAEIIKTGLGIPVIFLTDHARDELIERARHVEPYGYIVKPFRQDEIKTAVEVAIYRKEMEKRLGESEEKYRELFEHAADSIFVIDPPTRHILDVNENAAKRLGYTKQELLRLTVDEIYPPLVAQRNDAIIKELLDTGAVTFEHAHLRKDGSIMPVEISSNVTEYDGRRVYQSIARDITERKRVEEALRKRMYDLNQRVKELNCLYEISGLREKPGISLEEILQGVVELLPSSLQYPEITCARITLDGGEYTTENFTETKWNLVSDLLVNGEPIGNMQVYYMQERPEIDEGPFLKEERRLINAIAERLGRTIEHMRAEEALAWESAMDSALSELYKPLISPKASIEGITGIILDQAKTLTGSEHGYVSSIDPTSGDNISHTLTEMLKGQCRVSDENRTIVFPRGEDGLYPALWGYSLNTLEAFFTNSPKTHEASKGIPEGHIPLRRFLSVPVMLGEELVGQIALANKADDYTEKDLEAIHRIAEFYALAIQRKRAEEALQKAHDELEERVEERTAQLREANEMLKEEVKERASAEKHLRRNKSMLLAVFDGIVDPLILIGRNMDVRMINKSAYEYYGIPENHEVVGHFCYKAFRGRLAPCEGCEVPSAILHDKMLTLERKGLMDPDRLEHVVTYPVKGQNGEAGDAIIRITDITDQKLFEKQLIESEKLASLGILVSSVAHEINNPNSFIMFNMPILREYLEELMPIVDKHAEGHPDMDLFHMPYPEFRKDIFRLIDNIEHGSARISSVVSNLREFSRGKDKTEEKWIDLKSVIEKVLAMCEVKVTKTVKSFVKDIPGDLPHTYSAPYALEQILINLLLNAAQAADKKDSTVALSVAVNNSWQDHIIIQVSDNGCGMDDKTKQHIFDPFFSSKSRADGTGLGLYVTYNLVEALRGRIEVESEPGQGSTFRVVLPDKERRRKKR